MYNVNYFFSYSDVTPDDSTSASIVGLVAGVGVSIGVILVVIIIIVLIVCWKSRDDLKRKGKCCFTRKIKSDIYCTAEPDVIEMPALENEVSSSLSKKVFYPVFIISGEVT